MLKLNPLILVDCVHLQAAEQVKRYNNLSSQCQSVSALQDLTNFTRMLPLSPSSQKVPRKVFAPPQPQGDASADNSSDYNVSEIFMNTRTKFHFFSQEAVPLLRNELVFERHSSLQLRPAMDSLKREANDLEIQIRQIQVSWQTNKDERKDD